MVACFEDLDRRHRCPHRLVAMALAVWMTACAGPRDRWEDHELVESEAGGAPDPRSASPPPSTSITPLPHAPTSGMLVDRALQRFVSTRVTLRSAPKASAQHTHNWDGVLEAIDQAVQQPPAARDLGAFVRARITLEVELDTDVRRGVVLPADLSRRVQRTLVGVDDSVAALRAANAPGTFAPAARLEEGDFVLRAPLSPLVVSSPFGIRTDPLNGARRFHAGVDFDAQSGATIYASQSGLVVFAGLQGGYGRHVVIDHGEGVRTHYSHLSQIVVKVGMLVEEGQTVGFVGSTGRSTGPHLHFAVTDFEGRFLDPLAVLDIPFDSIASQAPTGPVSSTRPAAPPAN